MARGTYVMRDGQLVPKHQAEPLQRRGPRSALPMPMVISDTLDDVVHPATGERYASKKKFRDETRARGLTEVGNEAFPVRQGPTEAETRQEIQREIAEAYTAIEQGAEVAPAKIANEQIIKPELARAADAAV
jgi:hypothetical protein